MARALMATNTRHLVEGGVPDVGNVTWDYDNASDNTPSPDSTPEGQNQSTVSNCIRMIMGAVKRWWVWSIPKVTASTSTEYTASCPKPSLGSYGGVVTLPVRKLAGVSRDSHSAAVNTVAA
jgi:hypothetical protein